MAVEGTGPFENAAARDWLAKLLKSGNLGPIFGAAVEYEALEGDPYPAELAQRCVAAGEVLAALMGKPSYHLPTEVQSWVRENPITVQYEVLELTILAVRSALYDESSALRTYWRASSDRAAWEFEMLDLIRRLGNRG